MSVHPIRESIVQPMPTNDTGPSNDTGGASDHSKKPEPGLIATVSVELLQRLHAHHSSQLTLCDELEEIADSLPDQIDYIRCMRAAKMLDPAVRYAHRFEELELFPLLANSERTSVELQRSLQRLRFEHLEDESFAEELADKLLDIAEGRIVPSGSTEQAELLGYMLRGFFEGLRRHIAFERDHILSRIGTIN